MIEDILVSVIIPVYNVEKYIDDCLKSVIEQSHQNLEIIVINDGTKDNSEEIIRKYLNLDNRINLIVQSNRGLSATRNRGLEIAKGEYIYFLDSDDKIDKDLIKTFLTEAVNNDLEVVHTNLYHVNEVDGTITKNPKYKISDNVIKGIDILNTKYLQMVWLYFYKTSFLKNNNFKFLEGVYHEDELWTPEVLLKAKRVKVLNFYGYYYLHREGSITKSKNIDNKKFEDSLKILMILNELYNETPNNKKLKDKWARIYMFIQNKYVGSYKDYKKTVDYKLLRSNVKSFKTMMMYITYKYFNFIFIKLIS